MNEFIQGVIEWWPAILGALTALVAAASIITGMTETPKDDAIVNWIKKVLKFFAGVTHKDEAGTFKMPLTTGAKTESGPIRRTR